MVLTYSCKKENIKKKAIEVISVQINKTETSIIEGETETLTATVWPDDSTDKTIKWNSSDEAIAKVSETGVVTAIKAGKANIIAESTNGKSIICKLDVVKKFIHVESVELNKTSVELEKRSTLQLSYTILPKDASNKKVTWKSENTLYAKVTEDGLVTAMYEGTINVYAVAEDGGVKGTCEITIIDNDIKVKSVTLNKSTLTITKGTSETLIATILPEDATNKYTYWTSEDKSIASVSITKGLVSGIEVGTTTITVTTAQGLLMAECEVTVEAEPVGETWTDDRDGHIYKIVTIGEQTWMAENFAYLPKINKMTEDSYTEECYYVYNYDGSSTNAAKKTAEYKEYGVLYNHVAAKSACPQGWHLPSDAEWKALEIEVGMSEEDADKSNFSTRGDISSKFRSAMLWFYGKNGTNETGFNVKPAGKRSSDLTFMDQTFRAYFWTATDGENINQAWRREFAYFSDSITRSYKYSTKNGMSVRYIKDK